MDLLSTTPFGQRPVTAGQILRTQEAQEPTDVARIDKWALFRDLCTARHAYNVTDRDLTVLNALLSFHMSKTLSDNENLIVFPSNAALSERAHGMAESTLRRHLAALGDAGLIQRHDSPNGKRYAARGQDGDIMRAFGFDLRPLLVRAKDISYASQEARAAAERLRRVREEVVILKRDALKLCQYGQDAGHTGDWTDAEADLLNIHKQMRRKLDVGTLESFLVILRPLLKRIQLWINTDNMSGSDGVNERHYQNSNKDSSVFEPCLEKAKTEGGADTTNDVPAPSKAPNLPLALVVKACPDILPYASSDIRRWSDLVELASFVRGMMGISPDAWKQACAAMGPEIAATTVVGILQRVSEIQNPGGYLRSLTRKAEDGAFSPGPMIMALLNKS